MARSHHRRRSGEWQRHTQQRRETGHSIYARPYGQPGPEGACTLCHLPLTDGTPVPPPGLLISASHRVTYVSKGGIYQTRFPVRKGEELEVQVNANILLFSPLG